MYFRSPALFLAIRPRSLAEQCELPEEALRSWQIGRLIIPCLSLCAILQMFLQAQFGVGTSAVVCSLPEAFP